MVKRSMIAYSPFRLRDLENSLIETTVMRVPILNAATAERSIKMWLIRPILQIRQIRPTQIVPSRQ